MHGAVLKLRVDPAAADRVEELACGRWNRTVARDASSVGGRVDIEIYFNNTIEAELAARVLCDGDATAFTIREVVEEDWAESWKRHFPAIPIGARLRVSPPWLAGTGPEERIELVINPGLSFGTGHHFTTRFCLANIERLAAGLSGGTLLDIGTGSGILAIAAVRLGMRSATGVDSDPVCIRQAAGNAQRNGVAARTHFRRGDITAGEIGGSFDIVCANLYSHLLIGEAERILALTRRHLLLTGIGVPDTDAVAEAFTRRGAVETARETDGEWAGLVMRP